MVLSVVGVVPVEAPMVTSQSRDMSVQSFEDAHRGRICVYVFIRVSVHVC